VKSLLPAHARPASEWGDDPPLCSTRCMRTAALTVDDVPYCLDCADEWFDRLQAIELRPELRDVLPPLGRVDRVKPYRPSKLSPEEIATGDEMMERLGKAWASSPWNPANDPNAGRSDRPQRPVSTQRVTRDQPPEPKPEPAGQISLLAPEA
jgi:hypothetical protein